MKLNPIKCTFEVQSDKFLGFLITHRGIEVNPDQIYAITEMRQPSTINEPQRQTFSADACLLK